MNRDREAFLAGERPDDVAIYVGDAAIDDPDRLAAYGERLDDGVLLVVDGDRGRNVFDSATGVDPMAFARQAMGTTGEIDRELRGGRCPEMVGADDREESDREDGDREDGDCQDTDSPAAETDDVHKLRYLFSFAEAQTDEVDGIYAEGDVIHAYAQCSCGVAYSDRWLVE